MTVPRPASEHAREVEARIAASRASLDKIGEGDWTPQDVAHELLANAATDLLSALAVVEKERDELLQDRERVVILDRLIRERVAAKDFNGARLLIEGHVAALTVPSSEPAGD